MKVSLGLAESYDYAAAEEVLHRAETICPLPLDLQYTRLSIAKGKRDYETAEAVAQSLLHIDPKNRRALYERSQLALRRSDVVTSLDLLERYIKAGGELSDFLTRYAHAAADLGHVPELLRFCESCYTEGAVRGYIHLLEIEVHHRCNDAAAVARLMKSLEETDASRVADAEILLADQLVNRGDYEAALPRLARAIDRNPRNTFARSLFVGVKLALSDPDGGAEHLPMILQDPKRDFWTMMALCKTPCGVYPDLDAEADRFGAYFEPLHRLAKEVPADRGMQARLLEIAVRWAVPPGPGIRQAHAARRTAARFRRSHVRDRRGAGRSGVGPTHHRRRQVAARASHDHRTDGEHLVRHARRSRAGHRLCP